MVNEVFNYYGNNGSSVYMDTLDASKAFDRVNVLTLLLKHHTLGECAYIPDAIDANL